MPRLAAAVPPPQIMTLSAPGTWQACWLSQHTTYKTHIILTHKKQYTTQHNTTYITQNTNIATGGPGIVEWLSKYTQNITLLSLFASPNHRSCQNLCKQESALTGALKIFGFAKKMGGSCLTNAKILVDLTQAMYRALQLQQY